MIQSIILTYFTARSVYPSNAQIWSAGRNSTGDFDPNELIKIFFGNTPAPKGHFKFNAFNRDRDVVSGLTGLTTTTQEARPSTIAFFAGRVWYAGSSGDVYFSQIFKDTSNIGQCLQEQDPTAEIFNALLDTDGGVIPVIGAGLIISINVLAGGLVVIADNGVWLIQGGSNGFTATSFSINQLSTNGAISKTSVISAGGNIFYWGKSAIYEIGANDKGVTLVADLTTGVISESYKAISSTAKKNVRGSYNSVDKKVFFLYDNTYDGSSFRSRYKKILVFDTILKIFYDQNIGEIATGTPYIVGLFETSSTTSSTRVANVTIGGVNVTVGGVIVTTVVPFPTDNAVTSKAITIVPSGAVYKITFSEFYLTTFRDWVAKDSVGVSKPSFVEASPETLNVPSNIKNASWVTTHFKVTETGYTQAADTTLAFKTPSGCFMQARWDWSDNISSGRFGRQQQVYRFGRHYIPQSSLDSFNYGKYVLSSRTSIRGRGRSLSLRFDSDGDKDFNLLGWSVTFTVKV